MIKPLLKLRAVAALTLLLGFKLSAAVYYIDSVRGNDAWLGTALERPWKSLKRVNAQVFQAGDQMLFKAGTRYSGQLKPQGSGRFVDGKSEPIRLGRYGEGGDPRIDGEGKVLDTLLFRNVEFWDVADLEITNLGKKRAPRRTGVRIVTDSFGTMRHIHLHNLFVHDVNGDLRKEREGCGIFFESRGWNRSHFEDLQIEHCHVVRTDRNGICQRCGNRARSLGVVVRDNLLEDIGGDCIKLWGCNGGLVERNEVRGGRMRCDDSAAGIWPFDCDDTVIQFNEVSGMKGTEDGQGFDADYLCRRSIFQYNYSHDNDGGFLLVCTPGDSYNEDSVVRYNISQNDGIHSASVIHFGGSARHTCIYNNTIYVGTNQDLPLLKFTKWKDGSADDTKFFNNIFHVAGRVSYAWDKSTRNIFDSNVFLGAHMTPPVDLHAMTNCPTLCAPGTGGLGLDTLTGYKLKPNHEPQKGRLVAGNGGRDFFGRPVSRTGLPAVGAAEP